MGFRRRRSDWIGPVDQIVKIHYRKLRYNPIYNIPSVAHWALQVGEYIYELAAPAKAIFAQSITLKIREEIKQKALQGDEDYNEDEMLKNLLSDLGDGDLAFEEEDWFAKGPKRPFIMRGEKVPLQIGDIQQWPNSKLNKDADSITIGKTRLCHTKIRERAIHIFEEVFQKGYDILYNNCQAFVCYLSTSIQLLDPPQIKWNSRRIQKPKFQHRHFLASYTSYLVWKQVIGEFLLPPMDSDWKDWDMKEKYIEYDKMTSPQEMKEFLEPNEQPPSRSKKPPQKIRHAPRHEQPKSHAAHAATQAHHDSTHNQMNVLNAMIVQNQAIQQTVQILM